MTEFPFRKNVAGILINSENEALILRKKDFDFWQFPQGGVDEGERKEEALKRELEEETGIKNLENIRELKNRFQYPWPKELQERKGFCGQKQRFFLIKLNEKPNIRLNFEEGLEEFKWVNLENIGDFMAEGFKETWLKIKEEILRE